MKVVEVFSSIQGEGILMGIRATFVRLAGCNMSPPCRWCDTRYALQGGKEMGVDELSDLIFQYDNNLIVFTGGEPMLQIENIVEWMVSRAPGSWCDLAIETNGTIDPGEAYDWFDHAAVSPKLASSGCDKWNLRILKAWRDSMESVEFKFVVCDQQDLDNVVSIVRELELFQYQIPVILQPNGLVEPYSQALDDLVQLVDSCTYLRKRVRILPQLHRVIWGKEARGV